MGADGRGCARFLDDHVLGNPFLHDLSCLALEGVASGSCSPSDTSVEGSMLRAVEPVRVHVHRDGWLGCLRLLAPWRGVHDELESESSVVTACDARREPGGDCGLARGGRFTRRLS